MTMTRPIALLALTATCLFAAATLHGLDAARVTTTSGPLVGVSDNGIVAFKGIPYARPPVGALRWRAPQPVEPWTNDREATTFGASCPQDGTIEMADGKPSPTSEDCLTLNVWAPAHASAAPVMVFIHGGGNTQGSSARRYYSGAAFARDGVVLVTLNYRLGWLGFFGHPALTHEAPAGEGVGNYGLLDQIAALRWVKQNIKAFGGDPANVTVFGESAGAGDIAVLMTAAPAAGLFERAIVESVGRWNRLPTLAAAEASGVEAALTWHLPQDATTAQLRAVPAELISHTENFGTPMVDGRLLRVDPAVAYGTSRVPRVGLMIGANSDEGSLLGSDIAGFLAGFTETERATARTLYPGLDDAALARALFRDAYFTAPTRWIAQHMAPLAPTFVYRFDYVRHTQRGRVPGASHGAELPYVFDSWKDSPVGDSFMNDEDRATVVRLHGCWVAFAKTGAPSCPDTPAWPAYAADTDQLMEFDTTAAVHAHVDQARLDFMDRHFTTR
jgi:para-nitrobenzyl esterase